MNAVVAAQKRTPEDLLRMPEGSRYELIDGELVERTMSAWSSYVAGRTYFLLGKYCEGKPSGWVLPEGTSYRCFPDAPEKVRRADTSFIRLSRFTLKQANEEGHITIAPDLAVEVVSPNDVKYEVDRKVLDFQSAGTSLIWVINPDVRTVAVHRADGTGAILTERDTLTGENVLPGFTCKISDLFIPPQQP